MSDSPIMPEDAEPEKEQQVLTLGPRETIGLAANGLYRDRKRKRLITIMLYDGMVTKRGNKHRIPCRTGTTETDEAERIAGIEIENLRKA
jgi:hypothetical protein